MSRVEQLLFKGENIYRYSLDKSSDKFICPDCKQRRFVRYVDNNTEEYISEEVGRCDRENSCGYHMTPKEWSLTNERTRKKTNERLNCIMPPVELPVDYLAEDIVEETLVNYERSDFAKYVTEIFGSRKAEDLLLRYYVGHSLYANNEACVFWRMDVQQRVRTGKIMCYNRNTGKRNKEINPQWVHTRYLPFNYQLCFFGEHLLAEEPDKPVGIVESEKTAIIASALMPNMVWLATGGKTGCKWKDYNVHYVLKDRKVMLFPDFGYANKKAKKTCYTVWCEVAEVIRKSIACKIEVSRALENLLTEAEREIDMDLADLFINNMFNLGGLKNKNEQVGHISTSNSQSQPISGSEIQFPLKSKMNKSISHLNVVKTNTLKVLFDMTFSPHEISDELHKSILRKIFADRQVFDKNCIMWGIHDLTLQRSVIEEFKEKKIYVGKKDAELFLNYHLEKGWVVKPFLKIMKSHCILTQSVISQDELDIGTTPKEV